MGQARGRGNESERPWGHPGGAKCPWETDCWEERLQPHQAPDGPGRQVTSLSPRARPWPHRHAEVWRRRKSSWDHEGTAGETGRPRRYQGLRASGWRAAGSPEAGRGQDEALLQSVQEAGHGRPWAESGFPPAPRRQGLQGLSHVRLRPESQQPCSESRHRLFSSSPRKTNGESGPGVFWNTREFKEQAGTGVTWCHGPRPPRSGLDFTRAGHSEGEEGGGGESEAVACPHLSEPPLPPNPRAQHVEVPLTPLQDGPGRQPLR